MLCVSSSPGFFLCVQDCINCCCSGGDMANLLIISFSVTAFCWTRSLVEHTIVELALLTSSAFSPRNLQECKWFITCIGAPAFMLLWKLFSSVVHIWLYLLNYYHFLIIGVQYVLMIVEKLLIWWALDYSWVAYHASASCGRWRTLPVITSSSKWVMLGCSKWLRGDLTDDCINCCVCREQKLLLSHRFCLSGVLLTLVEFLELLFIKATLKQRFGRRLLRG